MASDPAVVLTVSRQIRIKQVQRNPTNLGHPCARHHCSAWKWHSDLERYSLSGEYPTKRYAVGVQSLTELTLLVGRVDSLSEVPITVQQAHAEYGRAHVAGRLQVIARQHAESARIDRQALGNGEFGGEVCDEWRACNLRWAIEVRVKVAF